MPTLAKPQLTELPSAWGAAYDEMYFELCNTRVPILTALQFYKRRDLLPPDINAYAVLTKAEVEELRQMAGALTEAAEASSYMTTAVLVATLQNVVKNPGLFYKRELPAAVEWTIARHYQRSDEFPSTHWRDVWGDQVSSFPDEVQQPTVANIAKAASAALATIQASRKRGRDYNVADQILAERLGQLFRASGQLIRRHNKPTMRHGKLVYVEGGGPFYDFLELVLKPLQRYLSERRLAPITVATIVTLVAGDFPKA